MQNAVSVEVIYDFMLKIKRVVVEIYIVNEAVSFWNNVVV